MPKDNRNELLIAHGETRVRGEDGKSAPWGLSLLETLVLRRAILVIIVEQGILLPF